MAKKDDYKKFLTYLAGFFILILGITLTLVWWNDVVGLVKGFLGIVLALAGLLILYSFNKK